MSIQFCKDCSNLLYPQLESGILQYVCNRCETTTDPLGPVISSTNLKSKQLANNTARNFLVNDLTLPRFLKECSRCMNNECVGLMQKNEERALDTYYICTRCFYEWTE